MLVLFCFCLLGCLFVCLFVFWHTVENYCYGEKKLQCTTVICTVMIKCYKFLCQVKCVEKFYIKKKTSHRRAHHMLTYVNFLTFSKNLARKFILGHTLDSPICRHRSDLISEILIGLEDKCLKIN